MSEFAKNFSQILNILFLTVITALLAASLSLPALLIYSFFLLITLFLNWHLKLNTLLALPFLFLPAANAVDHNLVLFCFSSTLLLDSFLHPKKEEVVDLPFFIVLLLAGFVAQAGNDFVNILYIIKKYSLLMWLKSIDTGLSWFRALCQIFLWYVAYIWFVKLAGDKQLRKSSLKFLLIGSVAAVIGFVLQIFFFPRAFSGMNTFWLSLGRFSGTFSDPNSAGISLFIIFVLVSFLLFKDINVKYKVALTVLLLSLFTVALYTGSRSFYLGLIVTLLTLFIIYYPKRFCLGISVLLLFYLIFNGCVYYFGDSWFSGLPSLQRLVKTLYLPNTVEMLSSRIYFITVGWHIFCDNWLAGIGLDKFYNYFPLYSEALHLTSAWSDNSCSFYLGILTDGGIILAAALYLSFLNVHYKRKVEKILLAGFFGVLVIFVVSHLLSAEVALLLALLSAFIFDLKKDYCFRHRYIKIILLILFAFFQYRTDNKFYGIYNWVPSNNGYKAWMEPEAKFTLPCKNGESIVSLAAPRRDRSDYPIVVTYFTPLQSGVLKFNDAEASEKKFICKGDENFAVILKSSDAWLPLSYSDSRDPRLLSLEMSFREMPLPQ